VPYLFSVRLGRLQTNAPFLQCLSGSINKTQYIHRIDVCTIQIIDQ
jgi:hypothetical protein